MTTLQQTVQRIISMMMIENFDAQARQYFSELNWFRGCWPISRHENFVSARVTAKKYLLRLPLQLSADQKLKYPGNWFRLSAMELFCHNTAADSAYGKIRLPFHSAMDSNPLAVLISRYDIREIKKFPGRDANYQ